MRVHMGVIEPIAERGTALAARNLAGGFNRAVDGISAREIGQLLSRGEGAEGADRTGAGATPARD